MLSLFDFAREGIRQAPLLQKVFCFEACVETAVVTGVVTSGVRVDVTDVTAVTVVTAVLPSGCEPGYEPSEWIVDLSLLL